MDKYKLKDLKTKPIQYEYEIKLKNGNYTTIKENALEIYTNDNIYSTKSPDCKGYSYWHENNTVMGNMSYDYIFACKDGLKSALDKLNMLIDER